MIKVLFSTTFLYLLVSYTYAQDVIYKINKQEIKSRVLEISNQEIKYKNFNNLQGPTYIIIKSEVWKIVYENGTAEIITDYVTSTRDTASYQQKSISSQKENIYGKNMLSINFFPLINGSINFSYERYFANQKLAIKFPFYIGYHTKTYVNEYPSELDYFPSPFRFNGKSYDSFNYQTVTITSNIVQEYRINAGYAAGVHLKYYPTGEGTIRIFLELGFEIGNFELSRHIKFNNYYYDYTEWFTNYFLVFDTGLLYQFSEHFNASIDLGASIEAEEKYVGIRIGTSLGYRF